MRKLNRREAAGRPPYRDPRRKFREISDRRPRNFAKFLRLGTVRPAATISCTTCIATAAPNSCRVRPQQNPILPMVVDRPAATPFAFWRVCEECGIRFFLRGMRVVGQGRWRDRSAGLVHRRAWARAQCISGPARALRHRRVCARAQFIGAPPSALRRATLADSASAIPGSSGGCSYAVKRPVQTA